MKNLTCFSLFFFLLFFQQSLFSQTEPVRILPSFDSLSIEGEAVFFTPKYQLIVGGRLCHARAGNEPCNFTTDLVVVDRVSRNMWTVPLANLPQGVAEQFAAVGLCTSMDGEMAWVLGGYGYDCTVGTYSTLGQMTCFPLEKTVKKLLLGERADTDFRFVFDGRLAVFDGQLLKIGDWFLLFNGHRTVPIYEDFTDRPVFMDDWSYDGELRVWRLDCEHGGPCDVVDFRVCYRTSGHVGCMPTRFYLDEKTWPEPGTDLKNR